MTYTARTLAVAICASGIIGGSFGALATDATQSQASPAAIAAAVQKVQDTSADATLTQIDAKLAIISSDLRFGSSTAGYELFNICNNTRSDNPVPGSC